MKKLVKTFPICPRVYRNAKAYRSGRWTYCESSLASSVASWDREAGVLHERRDHEPERRERLVNLDALLEAQDRAVRLVREGLQALRPRKVHLGSGIRIRSEDELRSDLIG